MPCLFALFAAFAPRVALFFESLLRPSLVTRAFDSFIVPLLGFIFLPFTTLIYVLVWTPGVGVTGWGWLWVVLGVLLDVGSYGGSAYGNRIPYAGIQPDVRDVIAECGRRAVDELACGVEGETPWIRWRASIASAWLGHGGWG